MAALSALPCFEVPSHHEGGHGSPSENLAAPSAGTEKHGEEHKRAAIILCNEQAMFFFSFI